MAEWTSHSDTKVITIDFVSTVMALASFVLHYSIPSLRDVLNRFSLQNPIEDHTAIIATILATKQ